MLIYVEVIKGTPKLSSHITTSLIMVILDLPKVLLSTTFVILELIEYYATKEPSVLFGFEYLLNSYVR